MNYLTQIQNTISEFIDQYGVSGLEQALQLYRDMQQVYICQTKTSISRLRICDILYLQINGHHMDVHTAHGIFHKYGSLNNELQLLSSYGFMKCNQSCIVSLQKIRTIEGNRIFLINNECLHLSRHYESKVLIAFSRNGK